MKIFIALVSLFFWVNNIYSQKQPINLQDCKAEFPGGKTAWVKFLDRHMPRDFSDSCTTGSKITVSFIVSPDSTLHNISCKGKILCNQSSNIQLQNEIVEMIAKSGKWSPALSKGKAISSIVRFPITICTSTE
ncbi:hypothetical protein ACI6Q2_05390 [Chitinophagaceae bacterium LWZ2-11]